MDITVSISRFFRISTTFNWLNKKKGKTIIVEWSEACEKSFNDLKSAFTAGSVLKSPDFDKHFYLQVDASDRGLGAVLSQLDNKGLDHPIMYFSRKLLDRETNYPTVEK
jgi:phospholipid-translocating ATPase